MDMGGEGEGGGAGDDMMGPMPMSLLLSSSCNVGSLFVRAWTIETCGQYYFSLAIIAVVCFLRHFLTMYKTRLILRLPEESGGASTGTGGVCVCVCKLCIGCYGPHISGSHQPLTQRRQHYTMTQLILFIQHNTSRRRRGHAPGRVAGGLLLLLGRLLLRIDHAGRAAQTRYAAFCIIGEEKKGINQVCWM